MLPLGLPVYIYSDIMVRRKAAREQLQTLCTLDTDTDNAIQPSSWREINNFSSIIEKTLIDLLRDKS